MPGYEANDLHKLTNKNRSGRAVKNFKEWRAEQEQQYAQHVHVRQDLCVWTQQFKGEYYPRSNLCQFLIGLLHHAWGLEQTRDKLHLEMPAILACWSDVTRFGKKRSRTCTTGPASCNTCTLSNGQCPSSLYCQQQLSRSAVVNANILRRFYFSKSQQKHQNNWGLNKIPSCYWKKIAELGHEYIIKHCNQSEQGIETVNTFMTCLEHLVVLFPRRYVLNILAYCFQGGVLTMDIFLHLRFSAQL